MVSPVSWTVFLYVILNVPHTHESCGNCFNKCTNGLCDEYGCTPGYYSEACTISCPKNCRDGISGKSVCSQKTGKCLSGCKEGFHGNRCDENCSPHCLNDICCQEDSICTQGCRDHWYGPRCMTSCNVTCARAECDRNGICKSCEPGFWGLFCENKCNPSCVDGICITTNNSVPKCTKGCLPGWKGANCDTLEQDISDSSPDRDLFRHRRFSRDTIEDMCFSWLENRRKCNCCKSGHRGGNCEVSCPNCLSKFYSNVCLKFCKPGKYGSDRLCSLNCSKTCKHGVDKFPLCDFKTGKCLQCLNQSYFGENCQTNCSERCVGGVCSQNTGACDKCPPKIYGDHCDKDCNNFCHGQLCHRRNGSCKHECTPGKFGLNCDSNCSNKCLGSECILTIYGYPVCSGGCVDRYRGRYCEEPCPVERNRCPQLNVPLIDCYDEDNGIIVGSLIATSVLVLATVIIVFVCRRKFVSCCAGREEESNRGAKESRREEQTSEFPLLGASRVKERSSPCELGQEETHSGLEENQLIYLSGRLDEFNKHEEGKAAIKEFFLQLGYSDKKTFLGSDTYSMLKNAPYLHVSGAQQAVVKLIVALRTAKMQALAQDFVAKYNLTGYLPIEFEDERRRQKVADNNKNVTASYGNPEQQQEQNEDRTPAIEQ